MILGTTIKDIAKLAGVSPATVSRVLSGQTDFYSEKTAKKVQQAVKKLGYRKNTNAVELVTQKSHVLAVIISTIQTNAADQIINGIQETAIKNNLDVIILYAGEKNADLQKKALKTVIERSVMGILLVAIDLNLQNEALLKSAKIPFLFLSIGFLENRFPFISSDDFKVGQEATQYLINKGHTKIGFAAANSESNIGQLRLAGYWKALSQHHIKPKLDWAYDGEYTYEDGIQAMNYYHQHTDLTAAVASSDLAAIGMLNQAKSLGIRIPEDFAVISIDGTFLCTIMRPQITSVTQVFREMGVKGVETLVKQTSKPFKSLYTPIKITERESS
ncbi:transcription regulator [Lentilactobacillus farraginis DSM 18382 = JCM 14108]|nr:transcription regulator [Lentilactobacillus farraginis DSM 18382 = JCM 14108]